VSLTTYVCVDGRNWGEAPRGHRIRRIGRRAFAPAESAATAAQIWHRSGRYHRLLRCCSGRCTDVRSRCPASSGMVANWSHVSWADPLQHEAGKPWHRFGRSSSETERQRHSMHTMMVKANGTSTLIGFMQPFSGLPRLRPSQCVLRSPPRGGLPRQEVVPRKGRWPPAGSKGIAAAGPAALDAAPLPSQSADAPPNAAHHQACSPALRLCPHPSELSA
jgi:hypothetical protein